MVYPSAPTEGDKLDDDDDDNEGSVVDVEEEEEDEEGGEIALLLSTLVDVAIVTNDVGVAVVADEADDVDDDTDDDATDEDDNATEEDVDDMEEVVDVDATPMYLAPRIPPFLTAAPRVFFR